MKKTFTTQTLSLLGILLLFFLLVLLSMVIFQLKGVDMWRMTMAIAALQNIGMFILPAIIVARIFNPGKTLSVMQLNRFPHIMHIVMMLLTFVASIPMMSALVQWNESWRLPEAMSGIETMLRTSEEQAALATEQMLSVSSIGQLLIVILIVGVLTGIGEEFLFRGSLQRLITESGANIHLAIWITAFIFSAVHMQFYGLVPRMLIGVFLGYLLVWSGSLWLPIMAHALNNSVAVVAFYNSDIESIAWFSESPATALVIISTIATIALIIVYNRFIVAKRR